MTNTPDQNPNLNLKTPTENPTTYPKPSQNKTLFVALATIGVIILGGGLAYFYKGWMTKADVAKKSVAITSSMTTMSKDGKDAMSSVSTSASSMDLTTMTNLSKFTDPELPGFSFNYPKNWTVKTEPMAEADGSGGPGSTFYKKNIIAKNPTTQVKMEVSTLFGAGMGTTTCFEKQDNKIIQTSKYIVIDNSNGGTIIEKKSNLSINTDPDFQTYFTKSAQGQDATKDIKNYLACFKSIETKDSLNALALNFTGKDNIKISSGYIFLNIEDPNTNGNIKSTPLSDEQIKDITMILDSVQGVN
jgi:hypothetical protein